MSYITCPKELLVQGSTSRVLSGQKLLPSRRHTWNHLRFEGKKAPEELVRNWIVQTFLVEEFWKKPGIDYHRINIQPYGVAWWGRGVCQRLEWKDCSGLSQCWKQQMKTWSRGLRTSDWTRGFTFQRGNEPQHTAKEWRRDRSLITFEGVGPATVQPDRESADSVHPNPGI